jgi:hypothetical protein
MRDRARVEPNKRAQAGDRGVTAAPERAGAGPGGATPSAAPAHSFGDVSVLYRGSAADAAGPTARPLPDALMARFEGALGSSLAGIRIHTDAGAAQLAEGMQARAVTVGEDIHFGAGQYQPGSAEGQTLLAHEVVHAAQQAGPAAATSAAGGARGTVEGATVTGSLETEAAGLAAPVARGIPVRVSAAAGLALAAVTAGAETASLQELDLDPALASMPADMKRKWVGTARTEERGRKGVTIFNANFLGGNEMAGVLHEVPTIHIGPAARAEGGETLIQLQLDYNDYVPLLHATLRAMGRLKDLDNAGAKLDPAAVMADPKLAAHFKPLDATHGKDKDRVNDLIGDFDTWSGHATEEQIAVASMGAGFDQLKAAISGFRAAEGMLRRRQKEAKLAGDESKKAAIDEKVETLVKIVETCFKAVEYAESVESLIEMSTEFHELETVEGVGGKTSTMTKQQSEGWGKRTESTQQSLGSAAAKIGEQLKKQHTRVESWMKEGGVTLKNVLIFATHDAKEYDQLTHDISQLKNDIAQLGYNIETDKIREAEKQLEGMKLEIGVRTKTARAKQGEARAAARTFGTGMAGNEGALAMFAAQAYQDLALFGGEADRLRRTRIDRYTGWLYAFVADSPYVAKGHGWYEDWITLRDWGQYLVEQRDFFTPRVPEWQQKAAQWNEFFAEMTGGGLLKYTA